MTSIKTLLVGAALVLTAAPALAEPDISKLRCTSTYSLRIGFGLDNGRMYTLDQSKVAGWTGDTFDLVLERTEQILLSITKVGSDKPPEQFVCVLKDTNIGCTDADHMQTVRIDLTDLGTTRFIQHAQFDGGRLVKHDCRFNRG
jgi:hypothetical protein